MRVSAGVTTEVNGPIAGGGAEESMWSLSSGATWALIWFIVSVLLMFVL